MKKRIVCVTLLLAVILSGCSSNRFLNNSLTTKLTDSEYDIIMKRDILSLMMAYPGYITEVERASDGKVYVVMKSGKKIPYDDKQRKNFQQKLQNPDIQDMLEQIYPLEDIDALMPEEFNPGRIRVYPLLNEVYGGSKAQIEKNLKNTMAGYRTFPFNTQNNGSEALTSAMKEITSIAQNNEKVRANVFPVNGTYNYRVVAGTNRLSPHSYGITIDLARDKRDYWQWATREQGDERIKSYPKEIVRVFEKNGFIWGGKWGYFDILHFEYRPEFIIKAKYFKDMPPEGKPWYDGIDNVTEEIRDYITIIEDGLS